VFNKKLKLRIKSLEEELGYAWTGDDFHNNLSQGDIYELKTKIDALINYLDLKNDSASYQNYNFKKKGETDAK